jgi:putative Mg2+ transporter-C (MgtC) family protein
VAGVLSGILGWEREQAGKPAGLRTHILVGMASALFMELAGAAALTSPVAADMVRYDPTRALHAVVVGVGFLGAGIVFVSRGEHVHGLTTAASIWATAGVGIAAGLRLYWLGVGAAALFWIVLRLVARLDPVGPEGR